jgi:hypothetical protein
MPTNEASPDRKVDLKYAFDRVDGQIRLELELIGQRITALCISQSFLVAAFVNVVRIDKEHETSFAPYRSLLLVALPIIGLWIAVVLGLAMKAAEHVIRQRKTEREDIRTALRSLLETSPLRQTDVLGHVSLDSPEHRSGQHVGSVSWIIALFWIVMMGYCGWLVMS